MEDEAQDANTKQGAWLSAVKEWRWKVMEPGTLAVAMMRSEIIKDFFKK